MTYAIKGQNILSAYAIPSRIIKLDGEYAKRGCAYGLYVECNQLNNAVILLKNKGIPYSDTIMP